MSFLGLESEVLKKSVGERHLLEERVASNSILELLESQEVSLGYIL